MTALLTGIVLVLLISVLTQVVRTAVSWLLLRVTSPRDADGADEREEHERRRTLNRVHRDEAEPRWMGYR